jgi:hypothetical protein
LTARKVPPDAPVRPKEPPDTIGTVDRDRLRSLVRALARDLAREEFEQENEARRDLR